MTKLLAACLLLAAAYGCSSSADDSTPTPSPSPSEPATRDIQGEVILFDSGGNIAFDDGPDHCFGRGGYSDVEAGAQVVVTDEAGVILATSNLDRGVTGYTDSRYRCLFTFALSVPTDATFYTFEMGRREGPSYSPDELDALAGPVTLVLGQ